jgi:hypothetical protein
MLNMLSLWNIAGFFFYYNFYCSAVVSFEEFVLFNTVGFDCGVLF